MTDTTELPRTRQRSSCSVDAAALSGASVISETRQPLTRTMNATIGHDNTGYLSFGESAKQETINTDIDTARITMRTRVAVRDKTPHRFQVIPLRDVSKISGHSLSSSENLPPVCTTPVTPKKATRTISTMSSFGWKHHSDLAALDHSPPKASYVEISDTYVEPLISGYTSGLSPGSKYETPRSRPSGSAISLSDRSSALSEWDINRIQTKKHVLRETLPSAERTTQRPSPMSIDSIHELIRSESPLTQTISRSLGHRTNPMKQPKSTSLSNVTLFNSQQAESLPDRDTVDIHRISLVPPAHPESDDKSYYSLLDAYEASEPTPVRPSTKRHAIYTPSLYMPYVDRPKSHDAIDEPMSSEGKSTYVPHRSSRDGGTVREHALDSSFETDPDATIKLAVGGQKEEDISAIDSSPLLAGDFLRPGLKHKSSSRSLPLYVPKALNSSKPLRPLQDHGATVTNTIVYPRIVLSLFADIDKAIEEWNL